MKILLLPLFTFPTGHSKVSETIKEQITEKYPQAEIREIDLLSYSHPQLEQFVAKFYLQWIRFAPKLYGKIYQVWMGGNKLVSSFQLPFWLQYYFERKMLKLIQIEKPDLIFCTHSFASHIVANVKRKQRLHIPIINVYTDLFINGVWNIEQADYHFVPTIEAKRQLMNTYSMNERKIFLTGIPVHPCFQKKTKARKRNFTHVLIAGGNTGLLSTTCLHQLVDQFPHIRFTVLCGNNQTLYKTCQSMNSDNIQAKGYISCPREMNRLYDTVDAIISKPGGVTTSEVIQKEIPLYISHYLPGQEERNVSYLLSHQLAKKVSLDMLLSEQSRSFCTRIELEIMKRDIKKYKMMCIDDVTHAIETIILFEQIDTKTNVINNQPVMSM